MSTSSADGKLMGNQGVMVCKLYYVTCKLEEEENIDCTTQNLNLTKSMKTLTTA